jgi:poly(3-hydroxybutyrate) depolymerase
MEQTELWIPSSLDGTDQPSLFYQASEHEKRPLLVGLHTWSFDRFNQVENMVPIAEKYGFHLLLPEFRGKNVQTSPNCKQACGSGFAKQDIKDAIDYVIAHYAVDRDNIFLLGASGGGHMCLMMAGFCPEYFKCVASFVPITDLKKWTVQNPKYKPHVMACCSGSEEEMAARSPVSYMEQIARSNTKIFHGKYDKVVPMEQSLTFYNQLLSRYPDAKVYLDIFDGAHQFEFDLAIHWILSQYHKTENTQVTG